MPFANVRQEMAMKINAPDVWKKWVRLYGHASGWVEYQRKTVKKAARSRAKSRRKVKRRVRKK